MTKLPLATGDRDRPLFPTDHAFVIALRGSADFDGGQIAGRVEHMSSGRAISFSGLEVLLEFMRTTTEPTATRRPK